MDISSTPDPTVAEVIAMQDPGDREACRSELEAATPATFPKIYRRWWAYGLLAQRDGRVERYVQAHRGGGDWREISAA
ncbi:hypothetical protein ACWD33_13670 [Streptomyces xiamenensis]|uniref:Uncharacterized protein n=1 Tax=Streptomyces xiamenensis TaxID=408015 RepID=A0A0F7G0R9_9ACTN|nr:MULTISPECIES: hypothetical protein [Streptomyces]AKG46780.1 hypothetical protein SXIM_53960 [Streptomyces xiamenensis]